MKYLLKSDSTTLTRKVVEELMRKHNIESDSVFYVNNEDNDYLVKVISEYLSSSFFEESKLILIRNTDWFTRKAKPQKDIVLKLNEIFEINTKNILVIQSDKLQKENPLFKQWKEQIEVIEMNTPQGKKLELFVKNYFNNHNVKHSNSVIRNIVERTEGDFDHLVTELNKLALLDEYVDNEVIDKVLLDRKGESIFSLVEAVFDREYKKVSYLIDKMKVQDIQAFQILQLLITDLTFMIATKNLSETLRDNEIISKLKLNPYRFKKIKEKAKKYSIKEMNILLNRLIQLEKAIKSNAPTDVHEVLKAKIISIN